MIRKTSRKFLLSAAALLALTAMLPLSGTALAQANMAYQTAPAPVADILKAKAMPGFQLSPDQTTALILTRAEAPSIAEMAAPILRLGGYRINPRTNAQSEGRVTVSEGLQFKSIQTGKTVDVALPDGARVMYPTWSPDSRKLAFALEGSDSVTLWTADAATGKAVQLGQVRVNAVMPAMEWTPDSARLIISAIPAGRGAPPEAPLVPEGPVIQENLGRAAPVRTFQDLLSTPHDEALFDYYFTSVLTEIAVDTGETKTLGEPGIYSNVSLSPDGRFLLVNRLKRPFSYVVTAGSFPTEITLRDRSGAIVRTLADRPLADNLPPAFDAVVKGPRSVSWRADAPATLLWAEALDDGDPRKKVEKRDRVKMLSAPFDGEAVTLADLEHRYAGAAWGRADTALIYSNWWVNRTQTVFVADPSKPGTIRPVLQRNSQDRFKDPGSPMMVTGPLGTRVLQFSKDGKGVLMTAPGNTREGAFPQLTRFDLATGQSKVLWQSAKDGFERVIAAPKGDASHLITWREGASLAPNYYLRAGRSLKAMTDYADPAPQFAGVTKKLITYKRADGVDLSGTLYLPAGYDAKKDGPLPLVMWAYPQEFTDPRIASQVVDQGNRFTRPGGASHLFLLTQGYAILDGPSMPIVGTSGTDANNTYVEQLRSSAEAAVKAVVDLGVADKDRIAVGGHSYGAFMTANLLAHTDLFRTGIARSGAYNRTLTPFGFQAEQRTYWEATDIYTNMSPFTYANKIKEPILLIHGMADDNSGTFPLQSERFYAALKGNGATVRFVYLPHESHGYRARESVNHTIWETVRWLDTYMKPKKAETAPAKN